MESDHEYDTEPPLDFDVLIIGTGAAGLTLALQLPKNLQIALLSKGSFESGSTWLAQGGIAAVLEEGDSIEAHVRDTLCAGAELGRPDAVTRIVQQGRTASAG